MASAQDRVIRKLERNGGEIRVKEGVNKLPSVKELFGVTASTVKAMIESGLIEKEGTATTTTAYRLVSHVPKAMVVNKIAPGARARQVADTASRSLEQRQKIAEAAEILFGDGYVSNLPIFEFLDWLELTKGLMDGS